MSIINRLKTLRPEVDTAPKINLVVVKANDHEVLTCVEQACQEGRVYAYLIDDKRACNNIASLRAVLRSLMKQILTINLFHQLKTAID